MIFAKYYYGGEIHYLNSGTYERLPLLYCLRRSKCVAIVTVCKLTVLGRRG